MTATLFAFAPNGTYKVFVAALNAGGPGNLPIVIVGGLAEQPAVFMALQVAMLITDATRENGSTAYSVCVAGSIDCGPKLASGSAIGIVATGWQPAGFPARHVAALITSILGFVLLPAYSVLVAGSTAIRNSWSGAEGGRTRQELVLVALQ